MSKLSEAEIQMIVDRVIAQIRRELRQTEEMKKGGQAMRRLIDLETCVQLLNEVRAQRDLLLQMVQYFQNTDADEQLKADYEKVMGDIQVTDYVLNNNFDFPPCPPWETSNKHIGGLSGYDGMTVEQIKSRMTWGVFDGD